MNDKDPGFWAEVFNGVKGAWPQVSGALLAVAVCYGRLVYDGKERKDSWIEPILCGLLAWTASHGLEIIGVGMSAAPFVGGAVGFIGVQKVRYIAIGAVNRRFGGDK